MIFVLCHSSRYQGTPTFHMFSLAFFKLKNQKVAEYQSLWVTIFKQIIIEEMSQTYVRKKVIIFRKWNISYGSLKCSHLCKVVLNHIQVSNISNFGHKNVKSYKGFYYYFLKSNSCFMLAGLITFVFTKPIILYN